MRFILALTSLLVAAILQSGCAAGASVGHDGHRHGVGVSGTTQGPGVSGGVRAY